MTIVPYDLRNVDPLDRPLLIVASPQVQDELKRTIDWKQVAAGPVPLAAGSAAAFACLLFPVILGPFALLGWLIFSRLKKVLPYPVLYPWVARQKFQFPLSHPIDGLVYACSEADPLLYVPLASFHRHMYEAKMAAFHELCAALGARRCSVLYAEEDGVDITAKVSVSGIPSSAGPVSVGVKGGTKESSGASAKVFAEYPRPTKVAVATHSGWMRGEPTWTSMQNMRLENNIEHFESELSYLDEMGVDAEVSTKVAGLGLKVGGKFEEFHRKKWIFEVQFWDQP